MLSSTLTSNRIINSLITLALLACFVLPQPAFSATPPDQSQVLIDEATVHVAHSNYYLRHFNFELAEAELDEAVLHYPDYWLAHRNLCLVSLLTGHPLRSLAEFMMVVGLGKPIPFNKAEQEAINNQAFKLHYQQGIKLAYQNRWPQAVKEFNWSLSYHPSEGRAERSLAFACANLGDFDKAQQYYERSFVDDPADAFGHADFAYVLSQHGNKSNALQQMAEAVELAPSVVALHVDLGWMAEARGDLEQSAREFAKANQLSPHHVVLWTKLGKVLEKENKTKQALSAYEKALALDPGNIELHKQVSNLKTMVDN